MFAGFGKQVNKSMLVSNYKEGYRLKNLTNPYKKHILIKVKAYAYGGGGIVQSLTSLQHECLNAILDCLKKHDKSPTRKELAGLINQKSTNGINQILKALKQKGYIEISPPNKHRNIIVTDMGYGQRTLFD